jgi:RanBP1 domain
MAANFDTKEWKERGVGMIHINRHGSAGQGRLVMRTDVTLKLILDVIFKPPMRFELVQDKNIRFIGMADESPGMYLLRLRSRELAEEALAIIEDLLQ